MIIGGNRSTLLNIYAGGKRTSSCINLHNLRSRLTLNDSTKVDDSIVLNDMKETKENICSIDPNSKSCKTATEHLNKATESANTPGSPLELNSPTVLSMTQNKRKKKVTFDVFTTPCPCVETTDEVLEKLDTGLCSPKAKQNVLDFAERIVDKYEDKNGEIVSNISIATEEPNNDNVLSKVATVLNATECTDEKCVLSHVIKDSYEENSVAKNLEVKPLENLCTGNLKPRGPRLNDEWLSNENIDAVLADVEKEFPEALFFKTTMTDFDGGGDKFLNISKDCCLSNSYTIIPEKLDNGKQTCFGCVINTDKTTSCKTGRCGSHWVSVFVDCRKNPNVPWTIEYFDSVGDPPSKEVIKWQEKISEILNNYRDNNKNELGGTICEVNNISHQKENTECGVYSLYFLKARTEGIPFSRFLNKSLPDYTMINYRRHLFSNN